MSIKRSDLLPNYITADSPQGLRRAMALKNLVENAEHQYFDIQQYQQNNKTRWIAWFYEKQDVRDMDADSE